ncbi:MAG TPA: DUF1102 domain-containing protein [Candidatus Thermoplasmatota archaeon]|nr:DUF1102 domain-containing protein [Candidatus Thermoplasmatota archaeon]
MGNRLAAFALLTIAIAGFYAANAFDAASSGPRNVTAAVVTDANSYLALSVNQTSPHKGFASVGNAGDIIFSFSTADGVTGTGVNPNSTYYFDDILNVTNQGTTQASVVAHATTTSAGSSAILVCARAHGGAAMSNVCYTTATTPITLQVGQYLNVGIAVNSTGISQGSPVTGTITIVASRPS